MTDDSMALLALIQKSDDGDFLKTVAETALQRIMDYDVENLIGLRRTSARPSVRPTATATEIERWRRGSGAWS
jgi:hypothetical protein